MRLADLSDYWVLRRIVQNPLEVVRFRKRGKDTTSGRDLEVRLRDGRRLIVRRGQTDYHVFNRIFVRDEYGLGALGLSTWDTVIDIGANVGMFACRVARNARRVICYEPSPANFIQLEENTKGSGGIVCVQEAVAATPGKLHLYRPSDGRQSYGFTLYPESGLGADEFDDSDLVTATSLDSLFLRHDIDICDLLKIDAEGAEYEMLHAASDATLGRVARITGEYHDVQPDDPRTRIDNFAAHLESKGFAVEIRPSKRRRNQGLFFARRR
jgi:FkbM family methyltransferase